MGFPFDIAGAMWPTWLHREDVSRASLSRRCDLDLGLLNFWLAPGGRLVVTTVMPLIAFAGITLRTPQMGGFVSGQFHRQKGGR
jgi:hypothetical protein